MTLVKYPAPPRRRRRGEQPDGGAAQAQAALNRIAEGILGRPLGFLDSLDVEATTYFDVFGEEPGDR